MSTVVQFVAIAESNGTYLSSTSPANQPVLTATVNDGTIDVGDEVTISGPAFLEGIWQDGGIPASGVAYYLGSTTVLGQTAYIFGADPTFASNSAIVAFFDSAINTFGAGQISSALQAVAEPLGTDPACFLAGTHIATPDGPVAVEALGIGDQVLTKDGPVSRVKWIGRQAVSTRFGPAGRLMPVRVRAGALGDGLPLRDLTLTADHALLIDGLLINAGALVNGDNIDFVPLSELGDSYTVYHVETEEHDILLAEGTPAETFIDYVGRQSFDNYAEYLDLYGADRTIPEMPYPRISAARLVPETLRQRLTSAKAA